MTVSILRLSRARMAFTRTGGHAGCHGAMLIRDPAENIYRKIDALPDASAGGD